MGPMSRNELIVLLVTVGSLVMFSTEKIHGIPTPAAAPGALFLLVMFRIISGPEISSGINWDVVVFFSCCRCAASDLRDFRNIRLGCSHNRRTLLVAVPYWKMIGIIR